MNEPIVYREELLTGDRVWRFDPAEGRVTVEQEGVELDHEWSDVPDDVREALKAA